MNWPIIPRDFSEIPVVSTTAKARFCLTRFPLTMKVGPSSISTLVCSWRPSRLLNCLIKRTWNYCVFLPKIEKNVFQNETHYVSKNFKEFKNGTINARIRVSLIFTSKCFNPCDSLVRKAPGLYFGRFTDSPGHL